MIVTTTPGSIGRIRTALTWATCTLGPVAALAVAEHLDLPAVAWADLGTWLETTSPETAALALAGTAIRFAALWILATTSLAGLAVVTGRRRLMATATRFALPVVRRLAVGTAVRLAVVSLVIAPASVPVGAVASVPPEDVTPTTAASEREHPLPPFVIPLAGERAEAGIDDHRRGDADPDPAPVPPFLPADTGVPTAPEQVAESSQAIATRHRVAAGEHLWGIAARRLAQVTGGAPDQGEIAGYWVRVVEANRDRIRSGDPDLIFPGEIIELPVVEGR